MLRLLTEEGRTRTRNAARRLHWYIFGAVVLAGLVGGLMGRYWVYENFTTLQREYLGQYFASTYNSFLFPRLMSRYTTLRRGVVDPKTKQEVVLAVRDEEIIPDLDDDNRVQRDGNNHIKVFLKSGVEHKWFGWQSSVVQHGEAYDWFRERIYDDKNFLQIWTHAWIAALLTLCTGIAIAVSIDISAQRHYLKGEPIRGTRKLTLRAYAQEHQRHIGYAFKVYDPK